MKPMRLADVALRPRFFWTLTVVVILWFAGLTYQEWALRTEAAPLGIVCCAMPQTPARAEAILDTWKGDLRDTARMQIRLDYPFLVLYPLWFFLALTLQGRRLPTGPWRTLGGLLAWAMLPVMGLDLYENGRMLHLLDHPVTEADVLLLTLAARLKFTLITASLLWLLVSRVRNRRPVMEG